MHIKKLLAVGFIILFLGLSVAPSINANVSKYDTKSRALDKIKHKFLYVVVKFVARFRLYRSIILLMISHPGLFWNIPIKHPILYMRFLWLDFTANQWIAFWNDIFDKFDWNWNILY
jgi:hypothetical protein